LNGYFEHVEVGAIKNTEAGLLEYLEKLHENDVLKPIRETGDFPEAVEAKLKEAITHFLQK